MIPVLLFTAAFLVLIGFEIRPRRVHFIDMTSPVQRAEYYTKPAQDVEALVLIDDRDMARMRNSISHMGAIYENPDASMYARKEVIRLLIKHIDETGCVEFTERDYKTDFSLPPGQRIIKGRITVIKHDEHITRRSH